MSVVQNDEPEKATSDETLLNNDFYCEKCYDMINYFIDECQTLAPKVTRLKSNYSQCKKNKKQYQKTLDALEFDYEEMKAQKEDFEEKYSFLLKTISKNSEKTGSIGAGASEAAVEPVFVNELKRRLSEKLEILEKSKINEPLEAEEGQLEKYENVEVINTITLDLNYLTKQFFSETKINSQKILEYFGRKILEAKQSDHKRHLEIKYEPKSKKKCTENDIELRIEISDLRKQLEELKTENETLKNQNSDKDQGQTDAKNDDLIKELNDKIASLKLTILDTKSSNENSMIVLNEELKKANAKCTEISVLNLEIQNLKADLNDQIIFSSENHKRVTHEYETQITNLEAELNDFKAKSNNSEKPEDHTATSNKITELETDLSQKEQLIQSLEETVKNLNESEANYQKTLQSLNGLKQLNETLLADKTSTKASCQEYENKLTDKQNEINDLMAKVNNYEFKITEFGALREELLNANDQLRRLRDENEEHIKVVSRSENEITELKNQCKLYEDTVMIESETKLTTSDLNAEKIEKLKSDYAYECQAADGLKKQLQAVVDEKTASCKELETVKSSIDNLNKWWKENSIPISDFNKLEEQAEILRNEKASLTKSLNEITELTAESEQEKAGLNETIDALKLEISKLMKKAEQIHLDSNNQVKMLQEKCDEAKSQTEHLNENEKELNELKQSFTNTSESIEYFKKEIESLNEIRTELTEQIEKVKADSEHELKAAEEKYQEVEKNLENVKENSTEANRQLTTELDSLKNVNESMQNTIEALTTEKEQIIVEQNESIQKLTELESNITQLNSQIQMMTETNTTLNEKHQDLENTLNQLRKNNNDSNSILTQERDSLKQKIDEIQNNFDNLTTVKNEVTMERDAHLSKVSELEVKLDGLQSKIKELDETCSQTMAEKETALNQVNELLEKQSQMTSRIEQLTQASEEINNNNLVLNEKLEENKALTVKVNHFETEISHLKSDIEILKETAQNDLKDFSIKLSDLLNEQKNLQTVFHEISSLQMQVDSLTTEKNDLQDHFSASKNEISQLKSQIDNYRAEVEQVSQSSALALSKNMENDNLRGQLDEIRSDLNTVSMIRDDLIQERDQLLERTTILESELAEKLSQLEEVQSHEEILGEKDKLIQEKNNCCLELESHLEALKFKINEIHFDNEQKQVQLQILNDQIQNEKEYNFHQEIDAGNRKFDKILQEMTELLKEECVKNQESSNTYPELVENLQSELVHVIKQLDEKSVEYDKLKELNGKILERLKQQNTNDLSIENKKLKEKLDELEEKFLKAEETYLSTIEKNDNVLRVEHSSEQCEIQMEVQTVTQTFEKTNDNQDILKMKEANIEELNTKYSACIEELTILKDTLAASKTQTEIMNNEWENTKKQSEEWQQKCLECQEQYSNERKQVELVKQSVNTLINECDDLKIKLEEVNKEKAVISEQVEESVKELMNSVDRDSFEKLSSEKEMIENHLRELQQTYSNSSESMEYFKKEIENLTEIRTDLTEQIEQIKADFEHERNSVILEKNQKVEELEKLIAESNDETMAMKDKILEMEQTIESLHQSTTDKELFEKLNSEKSLIENELNELKQSFTNTSESIEYFKKEIESLNEIRTELTEQIEKVKADSEHELKAAEEKYQEVEKNLENVKENSTEANRQLTTELDSLKNVNESMQNTIEALTTEKEQIIVEQNESIQKLTELESNITQLNSQIQMMTETNTTLNEKHQDLENTLNQLRKNNNDSNSILTQERDSLKQKIDEIQNNFDNLTTVKNEVTMERDAHLSKVSELEVKLDGLQSKIKELDEQNIKMSSELEANSVKINDFETYFKSLQLEIQQLKDKNEEILKEKNQFEENCHLIAQKNLQLDQELVTFKNEVELLTETHVQTLTETEALTEKMTELEAQNLKLSDELSLVLNEQDEDDEKIKSLELIINSLEQRLLQVQQEHEAYKSECKEKFDTNEKETKDLLAVKKAEFQKLKEVKNEKIEALALKLKESQAQYTELESLKIKLENDLTTKQTEFETTEVKLNEAVEKISQYENKADSNLKDLMDQNSELKSDIENYKEMVSSLTTTSSIVQDKFQKEVDELQDKLNEGDKFCKDNYEKMKKQGDKLKNVEIEYKNLTALSNSDQKRFNNIAQEYENCKAKLAEQNDKFKSVCQENEAMAKKLSEANGIFKLEIASVKTEYANANSEVSLKLAETEEKLSSSEQKIKELDNDLKATLQELSELKSELISNQEDLENQKSEWAAKGEENIISISSKASKFEYMYNNQVKQMNSAQEKFESKIKELNEKQILLNEDNCKLNLLLNNKVAEMEKLQHKLAKSADLIKKYEAKLAEKSNQLETSILKYSEEAKSLSVYETNYNQITEKLKAMNENLIQERSNSAQLKSELSSLVKEKENLSKELLELQRKLCSELTEKDNYGKELHNTKKEHEAIVKKYASRVESLKVEIVELREKMSKSNVSLESMMDKKIESNIQNKLDAMVEQSHKYLNDIENYKAEIAKLKVDAQSEVERLNKEHVKLTKEQKDKYNHTLKKHLNEIKKLKESTKEMVETNDFLTEQINNLNKQIFEYANKENECDSENTTMSKPIHKRLLDLSMNTSMANKSTNDLNQLSSIDMNNCYRKNLENDDSVSTPQKSMTTASNPMTPSSTVKKQNQCAQQ